MAGGFSSSPAKCPHVPTGCWFTVKTGPSGFYDLSFDSPGPGTLGRVGIITAIGPDSINVQIVPAGPATIVQNFRLKQVPKINVGQQTTVNVEPDSSLCTDWEDLWALSFRCERVIVIVSAGQTGTLTVEARATTGSVVPSMFWATTNYIDPPAGSDNGPLTHSGPGMLSMRVGGAPLGLVLLVGTPVGSPAQQLTVQATLR